jgi:hypothetical protein
MGIKLISEWMPLKMCPLFGRRQKRRQKIAEEL